MSSREERIQTVLKLIGDEPLSDKEMDRILAALDRVAQRKPGNSASLSGQKLALLKKRRFNPEGKAERVAKSVAALNQEVPIKLTPDEWRRIAEDPDIEDQF